MRLFLGMILGALLLIAGAYYHDSMHTSTVASGPDATQNRPMVNWDVVNQNWRVVSQRARDAWTTLSHKVTS